jgi:hypothetical protein
VNLRDLTDYTRIHGDGRLSLEERPDRRQVLKEGIPFQNFGYLAVKETASKEADLGAGFFRADIGKHQAEEASGTEPSSPYRQVNPWIGPARK